MKELDTITVELAQMQQKMLDHMQTHWRLFLFEGIFFILLGGCAFIVPQFFSVFIVIFLGWILVIGGITQLSRVLLLPKAPGFGWWAGLDILQLIMGFLLIADPIAGVLTLTMMMALFFAVEGAVKIYLALLIRPLPYWEYVLLSGLTALVLAFLMLAFWSDIPNWLLGVFLGVNMIMLGVAMVKMGLQPKA